MASLMQKLQLKPGQRLVVVNSPTERAAVLGTGMKGVTYVKTTSGKDEAVFLFVKNVAQAKRFGPKIIRRASEDCILWIAYPKGTSGITTNVNRDVLWKTIDPTGWRPVRVISLDETWSVMCFRPRNLVRSR